MELSWMMSSVMTLVLCLRTASYIEEHYVPSVLSRDFGSPSSPPPTTPLSPRRPPPAPPGRVVRCYLRRLRIRPGGEVFGGYRCGQDCLDAAYVTCWRQGGVGCVQKHHCVTFYLLMEKTVLLGTYTAVNGSPVPHKQQYAPSRAHAPCALEVFFWYYGTVIPYPLRKSTGARTRT